MWQRGGRVLEPPLPKIQTRSLLQMYLPFPQQDKGPGKAGH